MFSTANCATLPVLASSAPRGAPRSGQNISTAGCATLPVLVSSGASGAPRSGQNSAMGARGRASRGQHGKHGARGRASRGQSKSGAALPGRSRAPGRSLRVPVHGCCVDGCQHTQAYGGGTKGGGGCHIKTENLRFCGSGHPREPGKPYQKMGRSTGLNKGTVPGCFICRPPSCSVVARFSPRTCGAPYGWLLSGLGALSRLLTRTSSTERFFNTLDDRNKSMESPRSGRRNLSAQGNKKWISQVVQHWGAHMRRSAIVWLASFVQRMVTCFGNDR